MIRLGSLLCRIDRLRGILSQIPREPTNQFETSEEVLAVLRGFQADGYFDHEPDWQEVLARYQAAVAAIPAELFHRIHQPPLSYDPAFRERRLALEQSFNRVRIMLGRVLRREPGYRLKDFEDAKHWYETHSQAFQDNPMALSIMELPDLPIQEALQVDSLDNSYAIDAIDVIQERQRHWKEPNHES